MPEWPIAAGQAFWEACGLASTAKQRPPHGGDEPGIFRASGRYGCKLRHAGWAKAEKRLAIAKVPSAESTRHILTPTVSIDHSSTVYSPGRPRVHGRAGGICPQGGFGARQGIGSISRLSGRGQGRDGGGQGAVSQEQAICKRPEGWLAGPFHTATDEMGRLWFLGGWANMGGWLICAGREGTIVCRLAFLRSREWNEALMVLVFGRVDTGMG